MLPSPSCNHNGIRELKRIMISEFANLKNAFARFVTGVTVVSCQPAGAGVKPVGMTVNSFTSVSLEPPLVLWCIDKHSRIFPQFDSADNYAVSILRSDQVAISERFATPGRHEFGDLPVDILKTGAPVLRERMAALDCEIEARHDAGDHVILLGRVVAYHYSDQKPLMYIGRTYMEGPVITEEN